jgi:hypothetical protein
LIMNVSVKNMTILVIFLFLALVTFTEALFVFFLKFLSLFSRQNMEISRFVTKLRLNYRNFRVNFVYKLVHQIRFDPGSFWTFFEIWPSETLKKWPNYLTIMIV